MLRSFDHLSVLSGLEHYFFIPGDPRGASVANQRHSAVSCVTPVLSKLLRNPPSLSITPDKQRQLFKEIQRKGSLEKRRVLVGPADTRWGTHTKAFQRVIEN